MESNKRLIPAQPDAKPEQPTRNQIETFCKRTAFKNVSGNWEFNGAMTPERAFKFAYDILKPEPTTEQLYEHLSKPEVKERLTKTLKPEPETREPGYYWIKRNEDDELEPAEWDGKYWFLIKSGHLWHDHDFFTIDDKLKS